jgi:signal transduction histidine kinase
MNTVEISQVPSQVTQKWQEIVDLLAEVLRVPSALIMKVEPPNIKVFARSESEGNPYHRDELASLNTGLYCETVMKTRRLLLVPDALADQEWNTNPDIKLGMISYMGVPVAWPNGDVFGTICVLDGRPNAYSELYRKLLFQCRDVLQADLQSLQATTEIRKSRDAAEAALRELKTTQDSLIETEKLSALGRLVAGVAHEINNPVGVSLTVASVLERKCKTFAAEIAAGDVRRSSLTGFLEAVRDASSQLVANLNRAGELIQCFKQVATDQSQSEQRTFNVSDLTKQVLMSLRPNLRESDVTLNVECQTDLMIHSYPGPYGHVLTNLFLNSVTHAFPHGKGAIAVQVRASGKDDVEVLFSDDGCGMSASVRRQAFNPFFTTRRDKGCTGLGLHVVHNIVTHRLGGKLALDSGPGEGTKVQLILPRVSPESSSLRETPDSRL